MTLRTFSSGGGWQSIAALVLSAEGRIDFPVHLFSNVGDDSESAGTLDYVRNIAMPYAEAHGIEFHELHRTKRDGTVETLLGRLEKEGSRSVPIPVRMSNGAPGTRLCTMDFKLRTIAKWLKAHGASPDDPAHVGIGFSSVELQRANKAKARPFEIIEYPLIDLGISRDGCAAIITGAGLPMPPKSACWFCPMHRPSAWREMRRDDPETFGKAVALESLLNRRRDILPCPGGGSPPREALRLRPAYCATCGPDMDTDSDDHEDWGGPIAHPYHEVPSEWLGLDNPFSWSYPTGHCYRCDAPLTLDANQRTPPHGKDHVFFTRFGRPLDEAIGEAQTPLFPDEDGWGESCDEGTCFI